MDLLQALELSGEDYMRKDDSGNKTCNLSKIQNVLQEYAVDDMNDDEFRRERNRFMSKPNSIVGGKVTATKGLTKETWTL